MKIEIVILLSSIFIFIFVFMILWLVYYQRNETKRKIVINKKDYKKYIFIFLGASLLSYLIGQFTYSKLTTNIVFVSLLFILPFVITNEVKRRSDESLFDEVIIYCHNMTLLLKQTKNVYSSLVRIKDELKEPLNNDIEILLKALEESEESADEVIDYLNNKYNYSCIKNLNLIMKYMFYEDSNVNLDLLDTFQNDVDNLNHDVKTNQNKRKTLRFQYIFITVGCLLTYWYLIKEVKLSFSNIFDSLQFKFVNSIFIFSVLITLFLVDCYFNRNITKE